MLWIAFKLVSLQLQTQLLLVYYKRCFVVNCFQISIFAVANTTAHNYLVILCLLWIAFKLVSLQLQTQQLDLYRQWQLVVNCFQISIFAVANTTWMTNGKIKKPLWIAFKLVSLQLQTQLLGASTFATGGCELLSN